MAKFIVTISRVEKYSSRVLVDAETAAQAKAKVEKEWQESDYLWEKTTDQLDDATTRFTCRGRVPEGQGQAERQRCLIVD